MPKPGSGKALVRVFGFGCSAGTVGTDMADVVVAVGENCDLMCCYEVRCCACMSAASCTFEWVKVPEIQRMGC